MVVYKNTYRKVSENLRWKSKAVYKHNTKPIIKFTWDKYSKHTFWRNTNYFWLLSLFGKIKKLFLTNFCTLICTDKKLSHSRTEKNYWDFFSFFFSEIVPLSKIDFCHRLVDLMQQPKWKSFLNIDHLSKPEF